MLTVRGGALLVAAVVLGLVARLIGVAELYIVAATAGALVIAGAIAVRLSTATISVRRGVSEDRILHGGRIEATLELRNDARIPAALLLVEDTAPRALAEDPRFVVPGLGAGRTASLSYPLAGTVRGRYTIGPARIRVRDPFSLAQRVRKYQTTDEVLVYPAIERLGALGAPGSHHVSGSSAVRRIFSSGDEFYTMREYVTGDDLRQVHWPSTAHRQTLMVRQQEQPWQAEATVLCDTRHASYLDVGANSPFEKAISVAASIIWHLADERYGVRLVTTGDEAHLVHGRRRGVSWRESLDRLAEVKPSRATTLGAAAATAARHGEGLFIAVIAPPPGNKPLPDHPDVLSLIATGRRFGARMAVVIAPGSGRARSRADETAGLLRAAGWKVTVVGAAEPLAPAWSALSGRASWRDRGASPTPSDLTAKP